MEQISDEEGGGVRASNGRTVKRATQEQILNRRIEMLHMNRLGVRPKDWYAVVAAIHNTTEEAVKRDWSKRKDWMKHFLKVDDAEALALDILYDYEVTILDSYNLYKEAEDIKTKIQTMWLRLKAVQMKENFLREVSALVHIKSDFREKALLYR